MRTAVLLAFLSFLMFAATRLEAQAYTPTVVTVPQLDTVRLALDSLPRTIGDLVRGTKLPEPVVRNAITKLVATKEARYRLIPVASGDTIASGRPRRERAYYKAVTP